MEKFRTLADAIALAEFAHRNQVDKAGLPYIEHPRRVLEKVKAQGALPYVQMAAILHDVTEDTAFTPYMLLDLGVPESAVEIIRLVDRNESKNIWLKQREVVASDPKALWWTGSGYIEQHLIPTHDEFYYQQISRNPGAVQVKLADIEDNLSPWRLAYLSQETQDRLIEKYTKARELLGAA